MADFKMDDHFWQGDFVVLQIIVYADEEKVNRAALTNASVEYRMMFNEEAVLIVPATATQNGSIAVIADPQNGVVEVTLRPDDTALLKARLHQHQLRLTDSSGRPRVLMDGKMEVRQTIPPI